MDLTQLEEDTKKHFGGEIKLMMPSGAPDCLLRNALSAAGNWDKCVLDWLVEPRNLGKLIGAPSDSELFVSMSSEEGSPDDSSRTLFISGQWGSADWIVEKRPGGALIHIKNSGYIPADKMNYVVIYDASQGGAKKRLGVYLGLIHFDRDLHGYMSEVSRLMLNAMASAATDLKNQCGIETEFALMAAGGRYWGGISRPRSINPALSYRDNDGEDRINKNLWTGYSVWPKYGFDMPLLPQTLMLQFLSIPSLAGRVAGVTHVRHFFQDDQSIQWWKDFGTGFHMWASPEAVIAAITRGLQTGFVTSVTSNPTVSQEAIDDVVREVQNGEIF